MKKFTFLILLFISSYGYGQIDLPITFEDATANYDLVDFGDNMSSIVIDPTDASNTVGQAIKLVTAQTWAGTTNCGLGLTSPIPFTATETKMTVRIWSPDANTPIRLKVEDKTDPTKSVETEVNTTLAGAWETIEFDFANEAPGTAALNLGFTFDLVSIFFNFGTDGATAGEKTYFWDDVTFGLSTMPMALDLPITFENQATVDYDLVDFGDNVSSIVTDPTDATNTVGQAIKLASAQTWAGTTNGGSGLANPIPFTATATKMSVRVWSPDANTPILLKVEDTANGAISSEVLVNTTMAGAWETLEFDYSTGTPALNLANTYDKVSIFFNFGTDGATAGEKTYFWDDVMFVTPPAIAQVDLPITFEDQATIDYNLVDFGDNVSSIVTDPTDATNTVGQAIKLASAQTWAGTTNGGSGLANPIPFTATATKMSVRVWSPDANTPILLKVEDTANGAISSEVLVNTTMAGAWETLEFDYSTGTPALNLANTYDKVSIFFNFGTDGATAGEKTYFWDDVMFVTPPAMAQVDLPITFEDQATIDYNLVDFGDNVSSIVTDPTDATNTVGQAIKLASAQTWAGTTNGGSGLANPIPFTATATKMSVRVWSPDANTPILLKVEDTANGAISSEVLVNTTMAGAWETLEFDYSTGTPALNLANTYDKVSIFFNFGTDGATAGEKTYFWDDVMFVTPPALAQVDLPITFEDQATIDYNLVDFGDNVSSIVTDPTDATNTVGQAIKLASAQTWAGTTNGGSGLANPIPFTATATKMSVRVWSPDANTPILLKVEDTANGAISSEVLVNTTMAGAWETLEFDYSTGTPALNLANTYDKVSIFFNFGTDGATAGEKTYFWDDVMFVTPPALAQVDLPITFEDQATIDYNLVDFGDNVSSIVTDPTDATNTVGQAIKLASAQTWAGTTNGGSGLANPIPFTATATKMSVRVWSPDANTPIRLKVEDETNPTISVETEVNTTLAGVWETLEFDFSTEATGTAALNLANTYDKVSIFFNFGTDGATAGEKTYFWDDVMFVTPPALAQVDLPITFEDQATIDYNLVDFGDNVSSIVTDPTDATNTVGQAIKLASAQTWAGTTNGGSGLANPIPFTATATKMSVRVWSPDANTPIRLKVEDETNPTISVETEVNTTLAGAWETLEFDFSTEATGTAALNLANTYDKVSIFFNFGTDGATAGEKTYFWDDVMFVTPPALAQVDLPITFEDQATIDYNLVDFGDNVSSIVTDPSDATNTVGQAIKLASAQTWAGTTNGGSGLANPIPFSVTATKMSVRVWSPDANTPILLKVEDTANGAISSEVLVNTTMAGAWETLEFDYSTGTPALNLANTYDKVSIFFNFGTDGATAGEKTYFWDDVMFVTPPAMAQVDLPITFEDQSTIDYNLVDFGDNVSSIVTDPSDATNTVGQAIKLASAQTWAGTTNGGSGLANPIPFTATATKMSVRVWSPDANTPILLKVEDTANGAISSEVLVNTTMAGAWETLEFDYSTGTPALNLANTYDKVSIFFNFGTDGATAGEKTYFWDDVMFVTPPALAQVDLPITFEDQATIDYNLVDFGDNVSSIVTDPSDATNTVGQAIKLASAQTWAGTTNGGSGLANPIPFSVTATKMSVRVWSPDANTPILLKVEDTANGAISSEVLVNTTMAGAWETLEFDYSTGTPALNLANTYDKVSIFFNFGTDGATAGEKTYFWDDVMFVTPPALAQVDLPITFEDQATIDYNLVDFGDNVSSIVTDPTDATNTVGQAIKLASAQTWAGTTNGGAGLANPIPFSASSTKISVRVWSPDANTPILLKVEDTANGAISSEVLVNTTMAGAWETLEFDYSVGTPALNLANTYNKISIFFNFGTDGATAGEKTYFWDDIIFIVAPLTQVDLPITFEDQASIDYALVDFGGNNSSIITDPTDATNTVGQAIKLASAQTWAGTTNGGDGLVNPVPFTDTETKMTVRVWSPDANTIIRLKLEDSTNGAISVETDKRTTVAGAWETLEYDFSMEAPGTSPLNLANTYDKVSIFFNFGTDGATAGEKTYYWDDVMFVEAPLTQVDLPITFEDQAIDYALIDFGGNVSSIIVDPTDATNTVGQAIKTAGAQTWAGTTNGGDGLLNDIPFTTDDTKISVRVWSPDANTPILLKVEDATNPAISVETEVNTTMAGAWETLEFNFANQSGGTPALDLANTYNKVSIFFNFGTDGASAGEKTYFWDDVMFVTGGGGPTLAQVDLPITFEEQATIDYALVDFGGNTSSIIIDPTDATNTVGQAIKSATAEVWAGTTNGGDGLLNVIPFTTDDTKISVRVWSPTANTPIRLKVEDATNATISVETEANTTVAGAWEILEFNFANQAAGTAALDLANTYNMVSIFFNFGTDGATAGEQTYLWDDVMFITGGGGPTLAQVDLPITFEDQATIDYALVDFDGNVSSIIVDPTDATNTVGQAIKTAGAELWAGTTNGDSGLLNDIPFTTDDTKMSVRIWSPDANTPIRLKVEDATDPTISVETETNTTVAGAWETLEFNFANQVAGTASLDLTNTYNKVAIFFNFGTDGATAGEKTYFWDDVMFITGGGGPTLAQVDLPITFEDQATIDYALIDFGGNASSIVADPVNANNTVGQAIKTDGAEVWAGTTNGGNGLLNDIPFSANDTKMSVRVWSPDANTPIRLKVEDATDPTISVETETNTTIAGGWEILEFNFANQAAGTASLDLANTYNMVSIFFNFGTDGTTAGQKTYFWDDVMFITGGGGPTLAKVDLPITFEDQTTIDYALIDFGGNTSSIVTDPTNPANIVGQAIKTDGAEVWAGTTNGGDGLLTDIPFTSTDTKMSVRIWSPDANTPIRLKVEDATDPTISVETEVTTTVAGAWETLEFNFANQAAGTASLDLANTYNKVAIFFNFGTSGADAGEKTYYWDDVMFIGGGGPTLNQVDLPITFEEQATIDYALIDFGGNVSSIITDPTNPANTVGQAIKTNSAEVWAGTTNGGDGLLTNIPFTATDTKMSVRIWSPDANTPIRLKVEDASNGTISVETEVNTTVAGAWETLEFNFANQAAGTASLDLANTYNMVSIFFNFGTTGAAAGEKTYYWDDVMFIGGGGPTLNQVDLPITFEEQATIDYALIDFGGNTSMIITDPTDATNTVGQATKSATAEVWAGTTNGGDGLLTNIPFTATDTKMSVRIWSPDANTPIRLKVEDASNGTISVETEVNTTVAGAWETLEFNFANQVAGTASLDLANTYNMVSIFFNFGTTGAAAGEKTYYWDDVMFIGGGGPTLNQVDLPITFEEQATIDYALIDFGGNTSMIITDPTDATNTVGQAIKSAFAETWAGTTNGNDGLVNPVPFTASETKMSVRVWSPDANTPIRLKVEDVNNGGISVETEVNTTMAGAWETLEFDFSNEAPGTAILDLANTYNKVSIFFNFGTDGASAGEKTYYWDDIMMVAPPVLDQLDLPITFEDQATIDYALVDFGGNASSIIVDPTDPTNTVGQAIKTAAAQTWAGTTNGLNGLANPVPFAMNMTKMSVRVWSPDANTPIRLKVEDTTNPTISVETEVMTTVAGAWETLEFNFAVQAPGTPSLNLSNVYDKVSIFFNFGTDGATAGEKTYYWDDVMMLPATPLDQLDLPITFEEEATIDYALVDFGGNTSSIVVDPTDATNTVGQAIKSATAELWAGTTNGGNGLANAVPFTATTTKMSVRVWSPDANTPIRLKVEDVTDPTISVETEVNTTMAGAWETLEFDFSNEVAGTAVLDLANMYDKVSIFFNFGTDGATAGEKTYYWDDIMMVEVPVLDQLDLPITFEEEATIDYALVDFGGNASSIVVDPTDATNTVGQAIKTATAQTWAGTTNGGNGLANAIPFTTVNTKMTVRVWSPDANTPILLKVEDVTDPTISVETEVMTTTAGAWETLEFDFANEAVGTPALDLANTYDKVSIFFNFGTDGATVGEKTYYWDDVMFGGIINITNIDATTAGLKISPNPAHDYCTIELLKDMDGEINLSLFDNQGRLVKQENMTNDNYNLNVNDLSDGMYFLTIQNKNTRYYQKLVIKK